MKWEVLNNLDQLKTIDLESRNGSVLIFKHSTRCSISDAAIQRIERDWKDDFKIKPYYLDLIAHREISNALANNYGIEHQSPQVLMILNGKCIYTESHSGIRVSEIISQI